jgi:hypothetical protein
MLHNRLNDAPCTICLVCSASRPYSRRHLFPYDPRVGGIRWDGVGSTPRLPRRPQRGGREKMFVQECINGISHDQAEYILRLEGVACNWWRERSKPGVKPIGAPEIGSRLTRDNLFRHVNVYNDQHPDHARNRGSYEDDECNLFYCWIIKEFERYAVRGTYENPQDNA